jgi:two-component system response regulator YesN
MNLQDKKTYQILLIDEESSQYHSDLSFLLEECRIIDQPDYCFAIDYFFDNTVDLVILGIKDTGLCIEIIQFMKSVKPIIPIIIVTDGGSEDFAVSVFREGVRNYFRKPFDSAELASNIKVALGIQGKRDCCLEQHFWKGLDRAVLHIHENYRSRLRMQEVSRLAGMSSSTFSKVIKKETGMSFTKYVNNYRVSKAVDLLRNDGFSMSDIAFECGFTNQFHFTRVFKKITSTSPLQYRKSLNK